MKLKKVGVGALACLVADVALAGNALGVPVGITVGSVLGITVGTALPIAGSLGVAAVALVVGIRIVRRKR